MSMRICIYLNSRLKIRTKNKVGKIYQWKISENSNLFSVFPSIYYRNVSTSIKKYLEKY